MTTTHIKMPQVFFLNMKNELIGSSKKSRKAKNHLIHFFFFFFFVAKTRKTLLIPSPPSHVRKFMHSESFPCHLNSEV